MRSILFLVFLFPLTANSQSLYRPMIYSWDNDCYEVYEAKDSLKPHDETCYLRSGDTLAFTDLDGTRFIVLFNKRNNPQSITMFKDNLILKSEIKWNKFTGRGLISTASDECHIGKHEMTEIFHRDESDSRTLTLLPSIFVGSVESPYLPTYLLIVELLNIKRFQFDSGRHKIFITNKYKKHLNVKRTIAVSDSIQKHSVSFVVRDGTIERTGKHFDKEIAYFRRKSN